MNTILDIIHNAPWIELIISVYVLCLILLIVNMGRMTNGARCLISLSILTFFLVAGLHWLEDRHDTSNFFLYWAIGGAVGQFTFAGAVLLGILGGLPGIIITLLLGFFLCPLLWLRLVFSILWVSLAGAPKRSLAIILCALAGTLYSSSPSTKLDDTIFHIIVNECFENTTVFLRNQSTNIFIISEAEKAFQNAKKNRERVCYAITVEGYKPYSSIDNDNPIGSGGAKFEKAGEQTLILNVAYAAADLSACYGDPDIGVAGTYPIFILKRGECGKDCLLSELNPSQVRVLTNKYVPWFSNDLRVWQDVLEKLPDSPQSCALVPGMHVFLVPAALGNSSDSDKQALLKQVRSFKIKEIHYLDAEGNSHSLSASPIRKAIEMLLPSEK